MGDGGDEPSRPTEEDEEEDAFWAEPAPRDPAYGFWVVFVGLLAVVAVFGFAVLKQDDANDVVTIVAPAFAAIAGLVGAYFGLRAGTLAARQVMETVQRQPVGGQGPLRDARNAGGGRPGRRERRRGRINRPSRGRRGRS